MLIPCFEIKKVWSLDKLEYENEGYMIKSGVIKDSVAQLN